jgi:cell division protein ZapA (FtsZ GTPase activity inhibitor)
MADKNSVRIKIFGVEYVLKGDSDPAAMQELASIVDARMRELGVPGTAQTHRVAILAAFYFADELMKTRRALDAERQRYDQAARAAAGFDLKMQGLLHETDENEPSRHPLMVEEAPEDQEGSNDL